MKKSFKRILGHIVYSPPVKKLAAISKRLVLPGFQGMPVYDVADFFFHRYSKRLH